MVGAILRCIQWHYRNVTLFYRAELRLKVQQLLDAGQVRLSTTPSFHLTHHMT